MTMKKQILLLRISYWAAAISDFTIAILVLIPERMGLTAIEYPMGLVSAIAFSWGVLLLIADRMPFERRWILIPTILVVALLTIVRIIFGINETIEFSIGLFLYSVFLIVLMAYSYYCANKPVLTIKQD
jgi:hypothetical protein